MIEPEKPVGVILSPLLRLCDDCRSLASDVPLSACLGVLEVEKILHDFY